MPDITNAASSAANSTRLPTFFIDSDHPDIRRFAAQHTVAEASPRESAVALYQAVRDGLRYDPYTIPFEPEALKASAVLASGSGFCVTKAVVLAALLRASSIPARIGFADVRNHLTTPRLRAVMETDVFRYHGYTEVFLDGQWLKATPAFNRDLCEKAGIHPLEFDGREDSIFHPCDVTGRQHMEYLQDHGPRDDFPVDEMFAAYRRHYPKMFTAEWTAPQRADFTAEVAAGNRS